MKAMMLTGAVIFGLMVLVGSLVGCGQAPKHWSSTELEEPGVYHGVHKSRFPHE